jgi:hypothetical protein
VNLRLIAPKRRNVGNPWFKRRTLARAVINTLRRSAVPMTTREISDALLPGRSQRPRVIKLWCCKRLFLRKRNGGTVLGDGPRGKWRLKEAASGLLHERDN